jgi:ATP-binding protein involved in chromosome partitioning
MSITPEQVIEALKKVKHPEKKQDIVSLNMVNDLAVKENQVSFSLVFQRSNDPVISSLRKAATRAIKIYVSKQAKIDIHVKALQMVEKEPVLPGVKNIIAIASGKGGVGKSTVAANLAVAFAQKGLRTGLIDADIFGPSIPKMLGAENRRPSVVNHDNKDFIVPVDTFGVKMLSIGFFIDPDDPVIWRGPMASNALRQFINQTDWGELDYMFVDLPPGTSDIHLTMVQEVPITGVVIVSTPQKVAIADAIKGVNMFRSQHINVPVLGLIENMSWFTPAELPDHKYFIFGKDGCRDLAAKLNVPLLGEIPLVQSICEDSDAGSPTVLKKESPVGKAFMALTDRLIEEIKKRNENLPPTKIVEIKK